MGLNVGWSEPVSANLPLAKPFGLGSEGVPMHEILRILTGSVDLDVDGVRVELSNNHLKTFQGRSAVPSQYTEFIFDNQITVGDYTAFLNRHEYKNVAFFKTLKSELALCLLAKERRLYTESFLYLYRIVEHISLAFPLMFALTHDEFQSSYSFLRKLLNNDKEGELKVLKAAMDKLAAQAGLSAMTFEFSVSGLEIEYVRALKDELNAAVKPSIKDMEFEADGDILFRVPFNSMSSFFVTVRNRLFHYKLDQTNINLGALGGASTICRICLEQMLQWFSLVYTEIMRVLSR